MSASGVTAATDEHPEPRATLSSGHNAKPASPVALQVAANVGRRVMWALITLVVVSFSVFLLVDLTPGDAATHLAGEFATESQIAEIREQLHLDDPVVVRYGRWLAAAAQGDLGESLSKPQSVTEVVARALPPTLSLVAVTIVFIVVASLLAGILSATRRGGLVDRVVLAICSLGMGIPPFFIAIVLVQQFAIGRNWLPAVDYSPISDGWWNWFSHLILPGLALAGVGFAELTRQLRSSLIDTLDSDYVLAATARAIPPFRIVCRHALKNAAIPVITVLGVRIAHLLGTTVIIERVFAINGLGTVLIEAVFNRDLPLVLGIVIVYSVAVLIINLAIDITYPYFNPKLRR
jgi:peptide/nickel transport system permease protein